ncbi:MAG TPA: transposase [Geminicoccaceae bacterium]|nr:transposase [Geminicoccaceae bacterium]
MCAHGLLADAAIVSDEAGQFRIGRHALCWVHAERLVHRLIPRNERQRRAVELARQLIWWFYADLKGYKRDPCPRRRAALRARFDRLVRRTTGFVALDRLLARLHGRKEELLLVLDRPEIPLHTNHRGPVIRLRLEKRLALEWARGERPMPFWWRMTPDTNMAHGLRRA